MSCAFRPYTSGLVVLGTATADGALTLVNENGASVSVGSTQRVVLYTVSADGPARFGYSTNYLVAVNGAGLSLPWGLPLPRGQAPTVDLGVGATFATIVGEIID
jgi:hypothetical protein